MENVGNLRKDTVPAVPASGEFWAESKEDRLAVPDLDLKGLGPLGQVCQNVRPSSVLCSLFSVLCSLFSVLCSLAFFLLLRPPIVTHSAIPDSHV